MENQAKILITSDLHLGMEECVSSESRMETFKRICSLAADHRILLIAGGFVEADKISPADERAVIAEFAALREKGTEIFYAPGASELTAAGNVSPLIHGLGATHVFSGTVPGSPYAVSCGEQRIYIYGAAWSPELDITEAAKTEDPGFHIGLFHHDFDSASGREMLPKMRLDLYVLGSDHSSRIFKKGEKIICITPGTPEAVSSQDTGDRFVISVDIKNSSVSEFRRKKVNTMRLCTFELNCTDRTPESLADVILAQARADSGEKSVLYLRLQGERDFEASALTSVLANRFSDIRLQDESLPSLRFLTELYGEEDSVRGQFFRLLTAKLDRREITGRTVSYWLPEAIKLLMTENFQALEEWLCTL